MDEEKQPWRVERVHGDYLQDTLNSLTAEGYAAHSIHPLCGDGQVRDFLVVAQLPPTYLGRVARNAVPPMSPGEAIKFYSGWGGF